MLRNLISLAIRRAAADPRMRASAADFVQNRARPVMERKVADLKSLATEVDPRDDPAYFAGRALRRLFDR